MPSSTSHSLTLPIGEPIEETFSPYSSCRWRSLLDLRQLSFITFLMPLADVDEAQAVVLQPERGKGGKLLLGRLWAAASSAKPERITCGVSDMLSLFAVSDNWINWPFLRTTYWG